MKKSYLALGLVAAVAMSSCSNDEPMVNPNQQNPAKGFEPISLTLSNSVADVTVGTRGTGTVGSMEENKNNWNYEDIYVLMTSTQTRKEMGETEPSWGFTSAGGDGPFLHEQFNGEFWARPYAKDGKWGLNYFIDHNEWWNNAPIDKYYPMNGESQFFAFYVDDACEAEGLYTSDPLYTPINEDDLNTQGYREIHNRPLINKADDKMTVNFQIDGTQDLMLGKAEGNFSAKTAREGKVPSITMNHMLSRLTFNIKKDARPTVTSHEMVTVTGIDVVSQNAGTMTVAYKDAPENDELVTFTDATAKFSLKQYPASEVKEGKGHVCLAANDEEIKIKARVYDKITNRDEETGEEIVTYEEAAELREVPLYWYTVSKVKTFTYDDGRGRGPITPAVPIEMNEDGTQIIKGNVDAVSFADAMALVEAAKPEPPVASLMEGKAELVDFEPIVLKDFFATKNEGLVGEAMFVAPGVDKYEMTLHLSMLIREDGEKFDGVDEEYDSSELIETYELPLTLTMPEGKTFEAGMSYQVNITIYGLENVVLEIKPDAWDNGGHFDVGGDKDGEGIYSENGTHDDSEYDNDPSTGDDTEDDENGTGEMTPRMIY